jgi:iron-sulfur cluster assembly protein
MIMLKILGTGIQITEKALNELTRLGVGGEQFLRIRVVPGGCSGMTYTAAVDTSLGSGDEVLWHQDQIRVVADAGSVPFLDGLEIDFSDDLIQAGFRFTNPNAAKSCGCGSSFSA